MWGLNHSTERCKEIGFNFKWIQIVFKFFQALTDPKNDFPELKKFEIKYSHEGFVEINNFLHRNFLRFEMKYCKKLQ
jgi:hypothetical protein